MSDFIFHTLDYFFLIFHSLFTLFNALGWAVKKWRKWNLICLLLTGGSWFILGIFFGMGYCPFTDWHWQVLRELGHRDLPYSYIQYLLDRVFSVEVGAGFADTTTVVVFFVALAVSIYLNIVDYYKNKNATT
nr:DUF2784 domain-containing protein [Saprospiraceae bacterium]